jgi:serine/threonine-protein phosphatase PGAM5
LLEKFADIETKFSQDDKMRKLTPLGRTQAELTGKRLGEMQKGINKAFGPCSFKIIRSSDMLRAKETAEIIAKHLEGVEVAAPDELLNEALPAPIIPARPGILDEQEIDENHDRIESAFQKYMYRGPEGDESEHEFEIIVCHGNVIRYFFTRALQIPPEAWLRMSTFNCSLTYILIKPNGNCSARMMGDIGHLGLAHSTFSGSTGFAW